MRNEFSGTGFGPVVQAQNIECLQISHHPGPMRLLRQLPSTGPLVGRDSDLIQLRRLVEAALEGTGATIVIGGPPWVGKSGLAIAFAHEAAERFPDGQPYVDLRGNSPSPLSAADGLRWVLQSFGIARADLPEEEAHLVAAYRSLLSDRRLLVVLDNIAEPEQIEMFRPPTASSLVLATCRGRPALPVGAAQLQLDPLVEEDAVELLKRAAAIEPDRWYWNSAEALAQLAGGLPGLLMGMAPLIDVAKYTPPGLAEALFDGRIPLAELRVGGASLSESFAASCYRLSDDAMRAFRQLAAFPGDDITDWAVAAVTGSDEETARGLCRQLVAEGLLSEGLTGGRSLLLPMRRLLTGTLLDEVGDSGFRAICDRILHAYITKAESAVRVSLGSCPQDYDADLFEIASRTACVFMKIEEGNMVRLLAEADHSERLGLLMELAVPLTEHLTHHGDEKHRTEAHDIVLDAASDPSTDAEGAFDLLLELYWFYRRLSRRRDAEDCLIRAQGVAREADDDGRFARASRMLVDSYEERLAEARRDKDPLQEASVRHALGSALKDVGEPRRAQHTLLEALAYFRDNDHVQDAADVLNGLGALTRDLGQLAESFDFFQAGIRLYEQIDDREGLCLALEGLGCTLDDLGRDAERDAMWKRADELRVEIEAEAEGGTGHSLTGSR